MKSSNCTELQKRAENRSGNQAGIRSKDRSGNHLKNRFTALYMRLSVNGNTTGESDSIANQRRILTLWAGEHGLTKLVEYIDQGISGTTVADRPALQRLLKDVECGRIGTILFKDLSRFSRNYLESGQLLEEYFPSRDVRIVAVTNHYDSAEDDDSDRQAITPILSVLNQLYSRDISRKIKAIQKERDKEGKPVGTKPPFGYTWNTDGSGTWVPDEETAPIVRRIFGMFAAGINMSVIAETLTADGIATPHTLTHSRRNAREGRQTDPGHWDYNSIRAILDRTEYHGNLTNFRRRRISYKNHRMLWNDQESWSVICGSHAAIVDDETFEKVQAMRKAKKRIAPLGPDISPFSGKVFCADCGRAMTHVRGRHLKQPEYWVCPGYRNKRTEECCTLHFISDSQLTELISEKLRKAKQKSNDDTGSSSFLTLGRALVSERKGQNSRMIRTVRVIYAYSDHAQEE